MKYYFLALGTVVVICVGGCAIDGHQLTTKGEYHAPPAALMQRPGPMVDGPGPGVMPMMASAPMRPFTTATSQVNFIGPAGMRIGWLVPGGFAENQIVAPGRYNFVQGQTYRLKLAQIPGREGLVIYPTLQIYPSEPQTDAYLAHNSLPLQITEEDLDQVQSNNFVTKVIYLPDPKFQELALANVETLVSTRLDPGVDPIHEADRMGTIMAVLRMGNTDLEMPMAAPGQPVGQAGEAGDVQTVAHKVIADGDAGQLVPPMPIGAAGAGTQGVPAAMMVAGGGVPGVPSAVPSWGMPYTGTPIGLPGPTHLPYGGPASLRSHTVVNRTKQQIPQAPKDVLIGVKHEPGVSLPRPVSSVEILEKHPVYQPGELSYPAWASPAAKNPTP
ncbi:MAG: hypothetical protein KatS3mg113_0292 [Planctomycetaceae bacterium]|nr:MAG: hypothetical protein KatS3mg113_0292 [Planctomycetaceae bacterium]